MGANERAFGRFIAKEDIAEAASWEFEALGGAAPPRGAEALLSERDRRAYERGRQEGFEAGVAAAQKVRQTHSGQLARVLDDLRGRFAELESAGADQVLDLAFEIARQVVRHEIASRRDAVLPVLREAVTAVIDQHSTPRVYLNPHDHDLLRADLEHDGMFKGARFIADARIARGGCRVETQQTEVDGTVGTRWQRALRGFGVDLPFDSEPQA